MKVLISTKNISKKKVNKHLNSSNSMQLQLFLVKQNTLTYLQLLIISLTTLLFDISPRPHTFQYRSLNLLKLMKFIYLLILLPYSSTNNILAQFLPHKITLFMKLQVNVWSLHETLKLMALFESSIQLDLLWSNFLHMWSLTNATIYIVQKNPISGP